MPRRISLEAALAEELGADYKRERRARRRDPLFDVPCDHPRPPGRFYGLPIQLDTAVQFRCSTYLRDLFKQASYSTGRPYGEVLRGLMVEFCRQHPQDGTRSGGK